MKNTRLRKLGLFSTLLSLASLSSCTWSDPVQVEDDFGNSVRNMVEQQRQAPETNRTPSLYKSSGLDGNSAMNSLDQYRAAQKRKVQKDSLDSFELNE